MDFGDIQVTNQYIKHTRRHIMKCEKCGTELRIQKEEHCKDVNGNPMYRDYAYCDVCKTRTPLQNTQAENNFPPGQNPFSQKPPKKKLKTWQIVLIVFLGIAFWGAIFTSGDESEDTSSPRPTSEESKKFADNSKKDDTNTENSSAPKPTQKAKATKKPKPTLSPKQVKANEKKKAKKDKKNFIAGCKTYSYKNVMRNPDKYVGKKIKIKCQISQIQEGGFFSKKYFRCYSYSGYGIYAENEYILFDERISSSPKLLDDDIITAYGTIEKPEEITRALTGTNDEVFTINMKYVKLHKE